MATNLVSIIFGMKLRQSRIEADLTLTELAQQCELSPSYVTEIEKGRKYPRADKIMKIAEVLDKTYDELVSIKLEPSLTYLESTLSSSAFQRFPFDDFGFEASDLITLLTRQPDKASALLHGMLELTRRYSLDTEDFLRAALRSYQEINENYFQELEDATKAFIDETDKSYKLSKQMPIDQETMIQILKEKYGYIIDSETIPKTPALHKFRSVLIPGKTPHLLLNPSLHSQQTRFVLAREIGSRYLELTEQVYTSPPDKIETFQQIHNYFKAAYFGGALLMPRQHLLPDIEHLFSQTTWQPNLLMEMLKKYDVTPIMLLYRFSEIIPQFFGIKLHFLRFQHPRNSRNYNLIRQLNMNRLLVPTGIGLAENYCRRWLSVSLLRDIKEHANSAQLLDMPHIGVQYSEFLESGDQFFCIGFAMPEGLNPDTNTSVIVGFRVDNELKNVIKFTNDPAVPREIINETCERCPLTVEQCGVRVSPPTHLQEQEERQARRMILADLKKKFNSQK